MKRLGRLMQPDDVHVSSQPVASRSHEPQKVTLQRSASGQYLARWMIQQQFGDQWALSRDAYRRPKLVRQFARRQRLHFFAQDCAQANTVSRADINVTHDGETVAVVLSQSRVGIDVSVCNAPGRCLSGMKSFLWQHADSPLALTGDIKGHISKYFLRSFSEEEFKSISKFGTDSICKLVVNSVPVASLRSTQVTLDDLSGDDALVHAFRWHWAAKEAVLKVGCSFNKCLTRRTRTCSGNRSRPWWTLCAEPSVHTKLATSFGQQHASCWEKYRLPFVPASP